MLLLLLPHIATYPSIHCKNSIFGGLTLKDYIEERAVEIANFTNITTAFFLCKKMNQSNIL